MNPLICDNSMLLMAEYGTDKSWHRCHLADVRWTCGWDKTNVAYRKPHIWEKLRKTTYHTIKMLHSQQWSES